MLIEQQAYANRWRRVAPGAKGAFALAGLVAAFAAATPPAALTVAGLLVFAALVGARVRPSAYLRVAAPALFFLAVGSLPLAFSVETGPGSNGPATIPTQPPASTSASTSALVLAPNAAFTPALVPAAGGLEAAAATVARSLGALAALLFLVLTTPLPDLIALLRRLKVPETLLDLMVLCYRTLFVFSECLTAMGTAQAARLGYGTPRLALRSLGQLAANLAAQTWQRAEALHQAALARNNDGPLLFLEPAWDHARRDTAIAGLAGLGLVALVRWVA